MKIAVSNFICNLSETPNLVTKMRICVLGGAGHIGSGMVRALIKRAPDAEVVVADKNLEEAEELVAELGGKISVQSVDANDSKVSFE